MKKTHLIGILLVIALSCFVVASSPFPASTNEQNIANGWAHVNELGTGPGSVDLEFVNPRAFLSCFEYRTDGDTSQLSGNPNYNPDISDGLYPFICTNDETKQQTFYANEYVEIRLTFGAESDERFDWTRFDVGPQNNVPEFGFYAGMVALVVSIAGFFVMRRK